MPESVSPSGPFVEQYPSEGHWTVVVRGEIDMDSVPALRRVMESAAAALPVLVLDARAVTFADSSALNLLLLVHQATTLRIAGPPPQLLRLLRTTGADRVLHIYPSMAHACAAKV
ncbi:hypothetical protein SALBM135S_08475 [Streptomyces alboniger]